jgi:hypothetical protein
MQYSWISINKLGKSKLLATSYLWLIIVPIFAKLFSSIESPLDFSKYVDGLVIELSLPFSWKLFYFSAVLISIGSLTYYVWCPKVIQEFESYGDFKQQGKDAFYLKSYADKLADFEFDNNSQLAIDAYPKQFSEMEPFISDGFRQLYEHQSQTKAKTRRLCYLLYVLGITMISSVFIMNFYYVLSRF